MQDSDPVWFVVNEKQSTLQATETDAEYLLFDCTTVSDCSRGPPKFNEGRVIEAFPYANIFQDRTDGVIPKRGSMGTVKVYGGEFSPSNDGKRGVVWMNCQQYPSPAGKFVSDTREKRTAAFGIALKNLLDVLPTKPKSLAMPKLGVACSLDEDTWRVYMQTLRLFAMQNKIRVTITKALYEKSGDNVYFDAVYERIPTPPPVPKQAEYLQKLFIARPDVASVAPSVPPPPPADLPTSRLDFASSLAMYGGIGFSLQVAAATEAAATEVVTTVPAVEPTLKEKKEKKLKYAFPKQLAAPAVKWTPKDWFQTFVVDAMMKPGRIMTLRRLSQGGEQWCYEKQVIPMISSTDFKNFSSTFRARSKYGNLREALRKKLWWTIFNGNAFTQFGNDHEDNGMERTKQCMELDVFSELAKTETKDECGFSYVTKMNHALETEWVESMDDRPFTAFEKTDEHGINVHVGNFIMSTSYDGLFWVVDTTTNVGRWVYVEIKCPQKMYDSLCVDHWCQVVGSMGILRRQGIDVDTCLYAAWTPDRTRIWTVPFDQKKYTLMESEVVDTFMKTLLPLYVQRDNGKLEWGTLGATLDNKKGKKRKQSDSVSSGGSRPSNQVEVLA